MECPCACPSCNWPQQQQPPPQLVLPPQNQTVPSVVDVPAVTPAPTSEVDATQFAPPRWIGGGLRATLPPLIPSTVPTTTTAAEDLLQCALNCYGAAAVPVPLRDGLTVGDGSGLPVATLERCRELCLGTEGCEAVVYGAGTCYGKRQVHTHKCVRDDKYVTDFVGYEAWGTCAILGDPHILTFDNADGNSGDVTNLDAGIFKLITSELLEIQGRFGFNTRFPNASSLVGLAASGTMLQGDTLIVDYTGLTGFKVTLNGKEILTKGLGDTYASASLNATYAKLDPEQYHNQARHTIGGTSATGNLPSFHFSFAGLRIYVLLGEDTINAAITLKKLKAPMDGYCGNFDCHAADDTLEKLTERGLADALPAAQSLFSGSQTNTAWMPAQHKGNFKLQDCKEDLYASALKTCGALEDAFKQSCIFDVCASNSTQAGVDDVMAEEVAEEEEEKFAWLPGFRVAPLQLGRVRVSAAVQRSFAALTLALLVGGVAAGVYTRPALGRGGGYERVAHDVDEAEVELPEAAETEDTSGLSWYSAWVSRPARGQNAGERDMLLATSAWEPLA